LTLLGMSRKKLVLWASSGGGKETGEKIPPSEKGFVFVLLNGNSHKGASAIGRGMAPKPRRKETDLGGWEPE